MSNPIPEDQRYIVFPIEDPDTGRIDAHGWEWMDNGRDDPIWNDWTPGWEPLICELVPVAEADRLRAIERELGDLARLALHATRRDVEMFVHRLAYRHRGTSLGDALAAQDVVPAVGLRSEGGAS